MSRGESSYFALNQQQREQVVASCDTLRDTAVIQLPMYLGFRISEYLHLRPSWINRDSSVSIPQQQPCEFPCDYERGYWKPKTKAGIRTVYATDETWKLITRFLTEYPEGFVGAGENRQSLYYATKNIFVKAKIRMPGDIARHVPFPHALRATCATWLAENEMTTTEICQFMGWTDLRIAQRYINKAIAAKNIPRKLKHAGR